MCPLLYQKRQRAARAIAETRYDLGAYEGPTPAVCGGANQDTAVDISDARFLLSELFLGGETSTCEDASDSNDDGKLDISDPVAVLQYLFRGSFIVPEPSPLPGLDPTADRLGC